MAEEAQGASKIYVLQTEGFIPWEACWPLGGLSTLLWHPI